MKKILKSRVSEEVKDKIIKQLSGYRFYGLVELELIRFD